MNNFISLMKLAKLLNAESIEQLLITFDPSKLPSYLSGIKDTHVLAKILHYRIKYGPAIYKFCDELTDENFSFERFTQYQEYRSAKKTDSSSETYFQLKYGNKWEQYYQIRQSTRPNTYSIDHYTSRGLSHEEATAQISKLKKKIAPSIEKYIQKYGEIDGPAMFKNSCRYHKNYIGYWISKCGGNQCQAEELFENYKRTSNAKCIDFYLKRGYSKEHAMSLISEHQLTYAGVHRQYYENKGYTTGEIDAIMKQIDDKKDSASLEFIKIKYPDENLVEFYEEYNRTKSSRYREFGVLAKDDPAETERQSFYLAVRYFTRMNIRLLDKCPGIPGRGVGNYHIDHIFSIDAGYRQGVDPKVIGSIVNLQWMLSEKNSSKRQRCDMTHEELLRKYKDYENCKNQTAYV
jgi:hemerythrin superfamily protein